MENLNISIGIKKYQLVEDGAILAFNPGDPNVYARYMDAVPKIKSVELEMAAKAKAVNAADADAGEKSLQIMRETDQRMKALLNGIFGEGNDFDKILKGVNLMAVTETGSRVINNVLDALTPIMNDGAKSCVSTEVAAAKLNREQRRAMQ